MPPYLPPELIRNIVIQIECQKTLAACCLTCRAWAPIAQSEYFRDLCFGQSPIKTTRFFEVIRESPHIALLPRSISSSQWNGVSEDGTYLAEIAPLLINVSSLYFISLYLAYHPSQDTRRLVQAFPSLRELYFVHCTIGLHTLSSFFQSHPILRTLSIFGGDVASTTDQHQGLLPLRQLQHLRLFNTTGHSPLIPLFVDCESPLASIEHLELVSRSKSDTTANHTLLFGLRHTLHVLEVNLTSLLEETDNGACISILSLLG